jgi:hypothetical protein
MTMPAAQKSLEDVNVTDPADISPVVRVFEYDTPFQYEPVPLEESTTVQPLGVV